MREGIQVVGRVYRCEGGYTGVREYIKGVRECIQV